MFRRLPIICLRATIPLFHLISPNSSIIRDHKQRLPCGFLCTPVSLQTPLLIRLSKLKKSNLITVHSNFSSLWTIMFNLSLYHSQCSTFLLRCIKSQAHYTFLKYHDYAVSFVPSLGFWSLLTIKLIFLLCQDVSFLRGTSSEPIFAYAVLRQYQIINLYKKIMNIVL